jgi:uncharacterized membrane protein
MSKPNNRLWELDALRGMMILFVVFIHFSFDLDYFLGIDLVKNPVLQFIMDYFGVTFVILSGLCATIGSRPVKRGLWVLGGGAIISLVTTAMYLLGFVDKGIIIYFGVLHCIGSCMILWPLFRKAPAPAVLILGLIFAAWGLYMRHHVRVDFPWLIAFGFIPHHFVSSDYFPLLPNFGYFLMGAFLGKVLYKDKVSLLPGVNERHFLVRFFTFFGKNSLLIYLLHQPILAGLVGLWVLISGGT